MCKTINILTETNDYQYNILKTIEELNELATVLTQHLTKPNKVKPSEIYDEIGDVKIRLKILEKLFDKNEIDKRVEYKLGKFQSYLEKGEYKGKI